MVSQKKVNHVAKKTVEVIRRKNLTWFNNFDLLEIYKKEVKREVAYKDSTFINYIAPKIREVLE